MKEKGERTYMVKKSNKYFESLTEDICRFYVQNRADCLEQYNKAENPNLYNVYETINDEKEQKMLSFFLCDTMILRFSQFICWTTWIK